MGTFSLIVFVIGIWYLIGIYSMKWAAKIVDEDEVKPHQKITNQEIYVLGLFGPLLVVLTLLGVLAMMIADAWGNWRDDRRNNE